MHQHFEGEEFDTFVRLVPDGWDDTTFTKCRAQSVTIGTVGDALESGRSTLKRVTLKQCVGNSFGIGPLILEDCTFDRLTSSRHAIEFYGTAFKNCRFLGKCGRISITDAEHHVGSFLQRNERILADNEQLYASCALAIDISDASFAELGMRGIPGELIRINQEDQLLIDFAATEAFLQAHKPPENGGPLHMLSLHHDRQRKFGYNYVHVLPRTRSSSLLDCEKEVANILTTNGLTVPG